MHRQDLVFLTRGACLFEIALFLQCDQELCALKNTISGFYRTTIILNFSARLPSHAPTNRLSSNRLVWR